MSCEVKYLVVILDSKLNWKRNTEERMKKGLNTLYQRMNAIAKNWGLPSNAIRWIYLMNTRSVIAYGCIV